MGNALNNILENDGEEFVNDESHIHFRDTDEQAIITNLFNSRILKKSIPCTCQE